MGDGFQITDLANSESLFVGNLVGALLKFGGGLSLV